MKIVAPNSLLHPFYCIAVAALLAFVSGCKPNDHAGSDDDKRHYRLEKNFSDYVDVAYAIRQLDESFEEVSGKGGSSKPIVNISIELSAQNAVKTDGYQLKNDQGKLSIESTSTRGLMYGLLHLSEQVKLGVPAREIASRISKAHYPFRAIKFNLPWYSYRDGENLSLHTETARDLNFWEAFLNMMVDNKFNALTLWNLHPYMFMVEAPSFPKASAFSEDEMSQWRSFWKQLFAMAKERGIETYVVNWNIFVSEEFSTAYDLAKYSNSEGFWGEGETNSLIEQYTREMVTQTINEYEDLTGIGLTLGERMGGMTSEERRDWADRTIIAGLKNAKREARLIYRAPLSAGKSSEGTTSVTTEQLTREALETMDLDNEILVEFKFNWSHAHSSPSLSIVHGGMLTDTYWKPRSDKYKGIWTMRNEDFFVMRWAQPDFIRDFMQLNSQDYVGGVIVGSETYIPAKDYITKPEHRQWRYAFERQWLFYKVWGNLLYNSDTPDNYFASQLATRFKLENGMALLNAWKLASSNANRFASFYQGTWDATIYTEGFTTIGGKFIDIDRFISQPVLDKSLVNIADFVAGNFQDGKTTPLQLAEITEKNSAEALRIVDKMGEAKGDKTNKNAVGSLEIELTDIRFWAEYGYYFAKKIRAGVALEMYRQGRGMENKEQAIELLIDAVTHWESMIELAERFNLPVLPYQFDQEFSWRKNLVGVRQDIAIARSAQLRNL